MTKLTLISHHLCPYVQRAVIALTEKKVPFERIDVDLANKPDWFKALSPLGKTPVLKVGEAVIFESAVILEYLEETQPFPMHPKDPLQRAWHRSWIEFGSEVLNGIWGFYPRRTKPRLQPKRRRCPANSNSWNTVLDPAPTSMPGSFRLSMQRLAPSSAISMCSTASAILAFLPANRR
jgi:glutathione S-transferase